MQRKDRYWKAILYETIFDLIEYQYPATFADLDLARRPEFLDKELRRVSLKGRQKGRIVDVLVRVWLKNGEECWLLIYLEVQGYQDPEFDLRMYTAHYRIFEHFGQVAIALAIFTDNDPNWRPRHFLRKAEKTEIRYTFDTIKLLEESPEKLRQVHNPFAVVLETAWYALKRNKLDDESLEEVKFGITRNLMKANYSKAKIRAVFEFVWGYSPFADSQKQLTFETETFDLIQKEPVMQTIFELGAEYRAKLEAKVARQIEREKKQYAEKYAEKVAKQAAAGAAAEAEKQLAQHIENMLRKNFDLQLISEVLNVPVEKIMEIKSRLETMEK